MGMEFSYLSTEIPKYVDDRDEDKKKHRKVAERIISEFESFASESSLPKGSYQINPVALGSIIRRVNRRLTQFVVFHDYDFVNHAPSELKQAAIYAFWILKLKPFSAVANFSKDPNNHHLVKPLNEKFARRLIFSALQAALDKSSPGVKYTFNPELKKLTDYAFMYWDFTKESLVHNVEGLYFQMKDMRMK